MLASHLLPESAFTELAEGFGSPATIGLVREAQLSKHLMLLAAIAGEASGSGRGPVAFRAAYELLARLQSSNPRVGAWLLGLPHLGGWANDCLIHLEQGSTADFGHFACLIAAAAMRTGVPFELDVPVRDSRVRLPGLGSVCMDDRSSWTRLRCGGNRVAVGDRFKANRRLLVPDDGSGQTLPGWSGTPMVRAIADGLAWDVLLETGDPYLDRYSLPMSAGLSPDELRPWRLRVMSAWELLVRQHRWVAAPMTDGLSVIVPLTPRYDTDLVSATSPAAFGAVATSWPPDPVTLAETLVHEFQHVKLCGLLDMVPLVSSGGEMVYAPWRQDPRPAAGLLQGVYAHLGIVRFWQAQQHAEIVPDDILRAQVHLARWRSAIDLGVQTLLETSCLTAVGARFVDLLRARAEDTAPGVISDEALVIAREVTLDHWLTWQLRHVATDAATVADLAAAYERGEPFPAGAHPRAWVQKETRKVDSAVRSRLLNLRYLAPTRYRELCGDEILPLSQSDQLLIKRRSGAAVQAYRDWIADSSDPQPDAWIGLALALHQLPPSELQAVFATRLPLLFDVHARLGGRVDPLALAGWFR